MTTQQTKTLRGVQIPPQTHKLAKLYAQKYDLSIAAVLELAMELFKQSGEDIHGQLISERAVGKKS